jgi:hypothetical protein
LIVHPPTPHFIQTRALQRVLDKMRSFNEFSLIELIEQGSFHNRRSFIQALYQFSEGTPSQNPIKKGSQPKLTANP